jgi:hypothetical protein
MAELVSTELDYSTPSVSHASNFFVKTLPLNNQTTLTLTTSTVPLTVVSANRAFNMARSRIEGDLTFAANGAGNFSYTWADLKGLFQQIQITAQNSSQQIVNLTYADKTFVGLSPLTTTQSKLLAKPSPTTSISTTAITPAFTSQAIAQQNRCSDIGKSNALINPDGNGNDGYEPWISVKKVFVSGSANATCYLSFSIPLGAFDWTVASFDKLIDWGQPIQFDFQVNKTTAFTWLSTSAINPSTGAGASTGQIQLLNPVINFCYDSNQEIAQSLRTRILSSGIELKVPYLYTFKNACSGISHNFTINVSSAMGQKLLFSAIFPYNSTESNNTYFDHSLTTLLANWTSATYFTTWDSQVINTQSAIDLFQSQAYFTNIQALKDSCVMNSSDFIINFALINSWLGGSLSTQPRNAVDGLDITPGNHTFALNLTASGTSTSTQYYTVLCVQRTLRISGAGVELI